MATIDQLTKKADVMIARIDPRQQQQAEAMFPDLTIFTAEERAEVEALLEQIAPRLNIDGDPRAEYEHLTNEELGLLLHFLTLQKERANTP